MTTAVVAFLIWTIKYNEAYSER